MFDFSSIVTITLRAGIIRIRGINERLFFKDLLEARTDRRLINNMFDFIRFGVKFNEFFLPDVFFLFKRITEHTDNIQTKNRINKLLEVLKENTWLMDIDKEHPDKLNFKRLSELNYAPLDFQLEFMEYYSRILPAMRLNGTLLAAAPGSGKTFTTLATAHCLEASKIIIVCPLPAVIKVWEDNIKKVFKQEQSYWLSTSNRTYQNERIAVYHYEALNKAISDIPKLSNGKNITVILDESHNLTEMKSIRTQLFLELTKALNSKDIIFASGTPVKALGSDLISLFKAIDPLFTDDTARRFKRLYTVGSDTNAEILRARLGKVSFKVEKTTLKLDKPVITELKIKAGHNSKYTLPNIKVIMTDFIKSQNEYYQSRETNDILTYNLCIESIRDLFRNDRQRILELQKYLADIETIKKAYKTKNLLSVKIEIENCNKFENRVIIPNLSSELKVQFKEVKTLVKYRSLKIQGECLGRVLGRLRIECHVDMVNNIDFKSIIDNAEKKTVVFSSYTEVCERAIDVLEKKKYKPLGVFGKFTKSLSETVSKFAKEPDLNPLVATYASLSTAVPLIMANTMIMINSPFRAYIQEQAISRIHRLGNNTATYVYECSLDTGDVPNISTRGIDILKWSQEQVEAITGMENIFKTTNTVTEDDNFTIANESLDIRETYFTPRDIKNILSDW